MRRWLGIFWRSIRNTKEGSKTRLTVPKRGSNPKESLVL